ncbi:MAG: hypothetical protein ACK562_04195 [Acidobacteriota bacterium]
MNFNLNGPMAGRQTADVARIPLIRGWVKTHFRLPAETTILITQLQCSEEGCPPIETVIAILDQPGQPRQYKIHKPLAGVTDEDVTALPRPD